MRLSHFIWRREEEVEAEVEVAEGEVEAVERVEEAVVQDPGKQ
jgi:hypothetical protein